MRPVILVLAVFASLAVPLKAGAFRCAGQVAGAAKVPAGPAAAKTAANPTQGTRSALVVFARFADEPEASISSWASQLFDPDLAGSFSHYWDSMSFGQLRVRGQVAARRYASRSAAAEYLSGDGSQSGGYGRFVLEILDQVDADVDFSRCDDDGPDGVPDSGDDDGYVDAVFIVVSRVPADFLLGDATGIASLGLQGEWASADLTAAGNRVLVGAGQGSVLQGRTWPETVGVMCHEYGHLLGLVDLYNTDYLQQEGAPPEKDSAGAANWCLMGRGAEGWQGNDGPVSLGAFSRLRLGWSPILEVTAPDQELTLTASGLGGPLVRIAAAPSEYFLLEYRRREAWYDRHLPGEGVLVWHVARNHAIEGSAGRWVADVECADGRWLDAGYPTGRVADSRQGEDNLDFWAHDAAYATAHAGNLGDATDPFDGVRFDAFTPETNPSSQTLAGDGNLRVEGIRCLGSQARMQVHTRPSGLEILGWWPLDASGDGRIAAGEVVDLRFRVANTGGLPVRDVRVRVSSADTLVSVVTVEARMGDLEPGEQTTGLLLEKPRIRVGLGFEGSRRLVLLAEVMAVDSLYCRREFALSALSPQVRVVDLAVVDTAGNDDGQAQAGEFIRLRFRLEPSIPEVVQAFSYALQPISDQARLVGSPAVLHELTASGDAELRTTPEFLLRSDLQASTAVRFELTGSSGVSVWRDTLIVRVAPGGDRTPPRVLHAYLGTDALGLSVLVVPSDLLEGGTIVSVKARIRAAEDTTILAEVPLAVLRESCLGIWPGPLAGSYLVQVVATDAEGNQGLGEWLPVRVLAAIPGLPESSSDLAGWRGPKNPRWRPALYGLCFSPSDPRLAYLASEQTLWRSTDGGLIWQRTGLMQPPRIQAPSGWQISSGPQVWVDPVDGYTVYVAQGDPSTPEVLRSRDGGETWEAVSGPWGPGRLAWFLGIDPYWSGRLFADDEGYLSLSEDEGRTWRRTEVLLRGAYSPGYPAAAFGHPAAFEILHAAQIRGRDGKVWYSEDAGHSWSSSRQGSYLRGLYPDPRSTSGLYALVSGGLQHSDDHGMHWTDIGQPRLSLAGMAVHPRDAAIAYAWDASAYSWWKSTDGGATWEEQACPAGVAGSIVPHPGDPAQALLVTRGDSWRSSLLYRTTDNGQTWARVLLFEDGPPVSQVSFVAGRDGGICVASGSPAYDYHNWGIYQSPDRGSSWSWLGGPWLGGSLFCDLQQDLSGSGIILGTSGWGRLYRSWDSGAKWRYPYEFLAALAMPGLRLYPTVLMDPWQTSICYASTYTVLASQDDGATWTASDTGLPVEARSLLGGLALESLEPSRLYVAIGDQVWRTENAGQSWSRAGDPATGEILLDLKASPLRDQRLWAVTSNGLYLSADRGQTWSRRLSPDHGFWFEGRIHFSPHNPDWICLTTGRQLQVSEDAGQTWRSIRGALPGMPWYSDLAVDPVYCDALFAATPWGLYQLDARSSTTAVAGEPVLPRQVLLHPSWPNPFNPACTIAYNLPASGPVSLVVFDVLGQPVRILASGAQSAGEHRLVWDGRDDTGRSLASGVYLCRLVAGGQQQVRRLVLLR